MPRHAPTSDPFYAIRTRRGPRGIVYRVSFTRHGKNLAKLFRVRDFDNAMAALKAARAWRDGMTQSLLPETKQEFSHRIRPDNTSGVPQCVPHSARSSVAVIGAANTPTGRHRHTARGEAVSLTLVLGRPLRF